MTAPLLGCRGLDVAIGRLQLVTGLDLDLQRGEFVGVLGCNGAGKTTLLHSLAGLRGPADVQLDGQRMAGLARAAVARRVALLLQHNEDAFPISTLEAVLHGRHPHHRFLEWESGADVAVARAALAAVDLAALADRDITTLSGGERQRAAIATVLAQQPALYLLDEPLNNLDPNYQVRVLDHFRSLTRAGATVVAILHDLNLVARYADRVLLLYGPQHVGRWRCGSVTECMTAAELGRLYGTGVRSLRDGERPVFVIG